MIGAMMESKIGLSASVHLACGFGCFVHHDLDSVYLLKPFEFHSNGNISKSFTVGKSMVYFRNGALEFLESERWKAFDRCVTIIQTAIRGSLARKHYKIILKDPSRYEKKKLQLYGIRTLARTIFLLPKYLFRYIFGIVKRPPFQHRPSWH